MLALKTALICGLFTCTRRDLGGWFTSPPIPLKCAQNTHQIVSSIRIGHSCISGGLVPSQIQQFCLFTYIFIHKWVIWVNMIFRVSCQQLQSPFSNYTLAMDINGDLAKETEYITINLTDNSRYLSKF